MHSSSLLNKAKLHIHDRDTQIHAISINFIRQHNMKLFMTSQSLQRHMEKRRVIIADKISAIYIRDYACTTRDGSCFPKQ